MSANRQGQDSAGRFASAWIVAFGVACTPAPTFRPAWDPAVRPRPTPTDTKETTDASDVRPYAAQMHRWLGGVSRLRDAVTLGQEAVVAAEAAVLVAELRLDGAPPSWKPAVGRLRRGAAAVEKALLGRSHDVRTR